MRSEEAKEDAIREILLDIVPEWHKDLDETPQRWLKALNEMTSGYEEDPAAILSKSFDVTYDEMIVLRDVRFCSLCEHHILPFTGTADVAYVPKDKVVGLSKLARLVHCFAKRLQVQERLTHEIAEALMEHADPHGVGVVVKAHHSCMSCRGVREPDTVMLTSSLLGIFREGATRSEFLALTKEG